MGAIYVKDAGAWKGTDVVPFFKDAGAWKVPSVLWAKSGGIWKIVAQAISVTSFSGSPSGVRGSTFAVSPVVNYGYGTTYSYGWSKLSGTGTILGGYGSNTLSIYSGTAGSGTFQCIVGDTKAGQSSTASFVATWT